MSDPSPEEVVVGYRSLRANPSSGNLHPTEGYALLPALFTINDRPGVTTGQKRDHFHRITGGPRDHRNPPSSFFRMLARLVPTRDGRAVPWDAIPWRPRIHLGLSEGCEKLAFTASSTVSYDALP